MTHNLPTQQDIEKITKTFLNRNGKDKELTIEELKQEVEKAGFEWK